MFFSEIAFDGFTFQILTHWILLTVKNFDNSI
jgi:hypothetical protein